MYMNSQNTAVRPLHSHTGGRSLGWRLQFLVCSYT